MDRRLSGSTDEIRFRIDAIRCDGQGVCVLVAPELFELDRYGLAYVPPGADRIAAEDPEVRARGLEADAACPRNAIFEEKVAARPGPSAPPSQTGGAAFEPRLLAADDATEPLDKWRRAGGFRDLDPEAVLTLVEESGVTGQGGAGYPAVAKWRRLVGAERPVVVMNGAEREPGTLKDRYLLRHRPGLVLDGLRLAMRAIGATTAVAAVDEEAVEEHDALQAVINEATERGLLDGLEIRTHKVPTTYVAGEETALISHIGGGAAKPRIRPPYPSDIGLWGRPTLINNVETLAQIALAAALGTETYRSLGTADAPGTGLFSVGRFGGPYAVTERPYGYRLRDLLSENGLLDGARAVLVGGYAGGLLTPDQLDIALTPAALSAADVSLGTKSVQVIGPDQCPVGVTAEIVGYFGEETADQCPPCYRGLPDMAQFLRDLEAGTGGTETVTELNKFMSTLFDRGVCRLPDGAARVTMSLLTHFADEVEKHATGGCPHRA